MSDYIVQVFKEILKQARDSQLPKDIEKASKKSPDILKPCSRIGWYTKEDLEFYESVEGLHHPRIEPPFQGYLVQIHDLGDVTNDMEWDQCTVVMDIYPVEKCYCQPTWISYNRLLDDDGVIEIVLLKEK